MLLNYLGIKKGGASLDEIEDKLWELEGFSIRYNIASSKLVSITPAVSDDIFFKDFETLRVQIFAGTKLCA